MSPAIAAQDQTAQPPTRAAMLQAAREETSQQATPPPRSATERGLYWWDNQSLINRLIDGWNGFRFAGGGFPAGAGWKFGVGYDRGLTSPDPDPQLPNRIDLTALAAYSTRGYLRGSAALNLRNLGGEPINVSLTGQYYEFPQEDFFGIGQDSAEGARTNYLLDNIEAGVAVRWRPVRMLDLGTGVSYLAPRIGEGTDSRFPSTGAVYTPAAVPGLAAQPDFLRNDVSVTFDWRDSSLHPHDGGRYGVVFSQYHDRDLDAYGFRRVEVDLQQYVPLWSRYRVLALRAKAVVTDTDAGNQVPFYFQPTLGGAHDLRGFREFRFRDQNSWLIGAEYRWEAWWALDPAFFVDAGTVAHRRHDLSVDDMDVTYGVGFRIHSNSAVRARLDLAFSKEGFIPLLRFEHVF